jgi:hypothetical protein
MRYLLLIRGAVPGPRGGTRGHAVALHEDPSQPLSSVPPDE